jgi:hypothetical protein
MKKKRNFYSIGLVSVMLIIGFAFAGCTSSGGTINDDLTAGAGETLVIVHRESVFVGMAVKQNIYVDGELVLQIANGATVKFVIPNGRHTIYAAPSSGNTDQFKSDIISFNADSTDLYFTVGKNVNYTTLRLGD